MLYSEIIHYPLIKSDFENELFYISCMFFFLKYYMCLIQSPTKAKILLFSFLSLPYIGGEGDATSVTSRDKT